LPRGLPLLSLRVLLTELLTDPRTSVIRPAALGAESAAALAEALFRAAPRPRLCRCAAIPGEQAALALAASIARRSTVEVHVSRVYRKLDIGSLRDLAGALSAPVFIT
jgi:hypothetical protein